MAAIATNAHNAYNVPGTSGCETGVDGTGFGGKMYAQSLYIKPLRVVEFGGVSARKLKYLNTLKKLFEDGKLRFPAVGKWLELRRQLLGYQLNDKGLETDGVMALAVAAYIVSLTPEGSVAQLPFDYFHSGVQLPTPIAGPRVASYRSLTDMARWDRDS